jgi:hypothetical protein
MASPLLDGGDEGVEAGPVAGDEDEAIAMLSSEGQGQGVANTAGGTSEDQVIHGQSLPSRPAKWKFIPLRPWAALRIGWEAHGACTT